MNRLEQGVLIVSTLALSWLGLMVVHELGHVSFAIASGGAVDRVVLHPLAFSRTDLARNPHPRITAWGGALVGVSVPLAAYLAVRALSWRTGYLFRFFAGFCLIGNGAYLAGGAWSGVGDAADLMRAGVPRWALSAFGAVTIPAGLALWHGQGPHFGLGEAQGRVDRKASLSTLAVLILVVTIEAVLGRG